MMATQRLDDAEPVRIVTPRTVALRTGWAICTALLVVAAAFRLYLLQTVFANVDGDQAVIGVMAAHIQTGDRPVFFYGQPYTGSLEAYVAALVFKLWPASDLTLRLGPLAFSLAFVGLVYWLGAVLYGYRVAILSAVFLALGPGVLISWGTAAGANYIEVATCGTMLLLLSVYYPDPRAVPRLMAVFGGLLAGFGLWLQPLMTVYVVPLVAAYTLRLAASRMPWLPQALARNTLLATMGFVAGAAPLIIYNFQHHWITWTFLSHYRYGADGDYRAVALRVVAQSLPVLLGLAVPISAESDTSAAFARLVAQHPLAYATGLVLGGYLVVRLIIGPNGLAGRVVTLVREFDTGRTGRAPVEAVGWQRPAAQRDGILALFVASCILIFVFSHFGATYYATSTARYLLPLYTATPLIVDCLLPRRLTGRAPWFAALALASLAISSLALTQSAPPRRSVSGLAALLERRHITMVYANDYWIVYRLEFASGQRILCVGIDDRLRVGFVRVPGDLFAAARAPSSAVAWIFYMQRPDGERNFKALLRREHQHAQRTIWEDRVIYDHLSPLVQPAGLPVHRSA